MPGDRSHIITTIALILIMTLGSLPFGPQENQDGDVRPAISEGIDKPADPARVPGPEAVAGPAGDAREVHRDEAGGETGGQGPASGGQETRGSRSDPLPLIDEIELETTVGPGEHFWISFDPDTGTVDHAGIPDIESGLSAQSLQALDRAPQWMRARLARTLAGCADLGIESTFSQIIMSAQSDLVDEVAFTIAWMHPKMLQYMDDRGYETIIEENAEDIYTTATQDLPYVDLVEKSDHTTARYVTSSGTVEIPKMVYYLDVVFPRAYFSRPRYYGGDFWRDFFMTDSSYAAGKLLDAVAGSSNLRQAVDDVGDWIQSFMTFDYGTNYNHPIEIYQNPVGSCGQYSILTTAVARTALIPTRSVTARAEDHEWNEFYDNGGWIMWDNSLGEIGSNPHYPYIDMPEVFENGWMTSSYGGVSVVFQFRADEAVFETTQYTDTCTLEITVKDAAGNPVDGGQVRLYPAKMNTNQPRGECFWNYTDSAGVAKMTVGDTMDYFARVEHPQLGDQPSQASTVLLVAKGTQSGGYYKATIQYEASSAKVPVPQYTLFDTFQPGNLELAAEYALQREDRWCANSLTMPYGLDHKYLDVTPAARMDFFITTEEEYDKYDGGAAFQCGNFVTDLAGAAGAGLVTMDAEGVKWYAVWSNIDSLETTKELSITFGAYWVEAPALEITSPPAGPPGQPISGLAPLEVSGWLSCGGAPASVEVSVDGGLNWSGVDDLSTQGEGWAFSHDADISGLASGEHAIQVRAQDPYGLSATDEVAVLIDAGDPVGVITKPGPAKVLAGGGMLELAGTADDDLGVSSVQLEFWTGLPVLEYLLTDGLVTGSGDDAPATSGTPDAFDITGSLGGDGSWSYHWDTGQAEAGRVDATLNVTDDSGRSGTYPVSFFLDMAAPVVNVSSPGDGRIVREKDDLRVAGLATDDIALASLVILMDGEEVADLIEEEAFTEAGPGAWEISLDPGELEGEQELTLMATDLVGRVSEDSVTFFVDRDEPDVDIDEPGDGSVFAAGDVVELQGDADDDMGVAALTLSVGAAGGDPQEYNITEALEDGEFNWELDTAGLEGGEYTIIVTAVDAVGRSAGDSLTVILDGADPVLEVLDAPETHAAGTRLTLTGTATDDVGVETVEVSVDGGSWERLVLEGDDWTYQWKTGRLSPGTHELEFLATDVVGKTHSTQVTIELTVEVEDVDDGNGTNGGGGGGDSGNGTAEPASSGEEDDLTALALVLALVAVIIIVLLAMFVMRRKGGVRPGPDPADGGPATTPPSPGGPPAMSPPPGGPPAMSPPPAGPPALSPPPGGPPAMSPPPGDPPAMSPAPSGPPAMSPPPGGPAALLPPPGGTPQMTQPPGGPPAMPDPAAGSLAQGGENSSMDWPPDDEDIFNI